jgi:hypothetical protein
MTNKEQKFMSEDPNNLQWKDDKSAFGYKMLLKMGWKEKGIGKNQQGTTDNLKISKNFENQGLGVKLNSSTVEVKSIEFDNILKNLKPILNENHNDSEKSEKKIIKKKRSHRYPKMKKNNISSLNESDKNQIFCSNKIGK